ncbi:hypothetical protein BHQ19_18645 [Mycolicibacterium porcinum]|nr:hypothetical protein BHQ19_18645 [Mycolicibacterium porcinum]
MTLLNRFGTNLGDPSALVPLDEAALLATARKLTGLDDFGEDSWREPFGILLSDINTEANLTLTGRLLTRYDLLRSLAYRLQMTEAEKRHPDILEQRIDEPIFITGLGRTGTSILHESLAQDPSFRAPLGWEMRYPAPADEEARVGRTVAEVDLWLEVVPEFAPIHEISIDGPDEDSVGHQHAFASQVWGATNRVPNFEMWMATKGWTEAFAFQRRLLQHLQYRRPGRWILKGIYAACLPNLFAEFPDARVIMTHRDPLTALASTANMLSTLRWQRTDTVDYDEITGPLGFGIPFVLDMVVDQRASGVVPDDRFIDVRFADLMSDYMATIGSIYDQLGLPLTDDARSRIQSYLDAKPRGRHGTHAYRVEDLGLDTAELRTKFAGYMTRFNVPEESHQ